MQHVSWTYVEGYAVPTGEPLLIGGTRRTHSEHRGQYRPKLSPPSGVRHAGVDSFLVWQLTTSNLPTLLAEVDLLLAEDPE